MKYLDYAVSLQPSIYGIASNFIEIVSSHANVCDNTIANFRGFQTSVIRCGIAFLGIAVSETINKPISTRTALRIFNATITGTSVIAASIMLTPKEHSNFIENLLNATGYALCDFISAKLFCTAYNKYFGSECRNYELSNKLEKSIKLPTYIAEQLVNEVDPNRLHEFIDMNDGHPDLHNLEALMDFLNKFIEIKRKQEAGSRNGN